LHPVGLISDMQSAANECDRFPVLAAAVDGNSSSTVDEVGWNLRQDTIVANRPVPA
jgi:hypothetical protein